MINWELRTYIETQITRGVEESLIRKTLLDVGWRSEDVQEAFLAIMPLYTQPIIVPTDTQPQGVKVMPNIDVSSKRSSMKSIFIGLTLLVFVGGGSFAYISYVKIPSPQIALQKMMSALGQITTLEYKVQASTEGATCTDMQYSFLGEGEAMSVCNSKKPFSNTTTISGVADITSFENPMHQLTLVSENTLQNEEGVSEKASIQVDLISVQKALYIKVSNLVFPLASFFDTTLFINKWISFDIAGLQKQYLGTDSSTNTRPISTDKVERIKEAFLNANLLSVVDATQDVFEGNDVYKYTFEINQEQQKEFIMQVYSILYEGVNGADGEISQENIEAISESVKNLGVIEGELWLSKKDFLPYKIVLNPDVVMYDGVFEVTSANTVLEFKNYNVPISIQAPASTMSFNEVMAKLFAPIPEVATTTPIKIVPKK